MTTALAAGTLLSRFEERCPPPRMAGQVRDGLPTGPSNPSPGLMP